MTYLISTFANIKPVLNHISLLPQSLHVPKDDSVRYIRDLLRRVSRGRNLQVNVCIWHLDCYSNDLLSSVDVKACYRVGIISYYLHTSSKHPLTKTQFLAIGRSFFKCI